MSKTIFFIILGLTVLFLGFLAVSGKLYPGSKGILPVGQPATTNVQQIAPQNIAPTSDEIPLFKSQTATFQGKITKINGKTLDVEADNGQKGRFDLSDKVIIYTFTGSTSIASPSTDLKLLETDKKVIINLELINGKFQAVAVSYFRT